MPKDQYCYPALSYYPLKREKNVLHTFQVCKKLIEISIYFI